MVTEYKAKMYFKWNKGKLTGGVMFAILLAIAFLDNKSWTLAIIAVIVAFVLIAMVIMIPFDADIDASFSKLAQMHTKESLDRLGINESDIVREPLTIIGVGNYKQAKKGRDKLWRFNPMVVEVIHFGKNQLLTNTVQLDLLNQKNYIGKTNEFFYKDISTVSIEDVDIKDDNLVRVANKRFLIKVHGQVELNTAIQKNQEATAEDAVKTIRKTLREKKQA